MPKRKRAPDEPEAQSRRFLEAAEQVGADASGRKFEKAFKKLLPPSSKLRRTKRAGKA